MAQVRIVFADDGHQGRAFANELYRREGVELRIVRRGGPHFFRVTGLTWIVERTFAWLGANRRLAREYEFRVGTFDSLIELAAIRIMLRRIAC